MRVLVIGGTGFIGARVALALARLGHSALIVGRRRSSIPDAECVAADRTDPPAIARLAAARNCDALIDMIAYEAGSTTALHEAVRGLIGRYLLISSADVYRAYGGLHRTEMCPPDTALLTEDSPLRGVLYPYRKAEPRAADDPLAWHDAYDKIPIEQALAAHDCTTLRLPMVYGPGARNRFSWITAPMLSGADRLAPPNAWLSWRSTYAHVDDVAAAIALCVTHPRAAGRTYHCGDEAVTHREWVARFAALTGWRGKIVTDEDSPFAETLASLDLRHHLGLDTTRIRTELGFKEVMPSDQALRSVLTPA